MGGKIVPEALRGRLVTLREAVPEDAAFILSLRCDEKKARFLHRTEYDIPRQEAYLRRYAALDDEWYFVSLNAAGMRIGTYRIYDLSPDSFCIGSWLMADAATPQESVETDYVCRMYGFDVLGFGKAHFDVRKGNRTVWRYHEALGARRTGETELDYLYECTREDYTRAYGRIMNTQENQL